VPIIDWSWTGSTRAFPQSDWKLLARVLGTLRLSFDGQVASVSVTRQMFDETGARDDLTDGFVDFPRSIRGWRWPRFSARWARGSIA